MVDSGITLAFITYPSAFLDMVVPPLWNFFFFFMLVNLAINGLAAGNQMIVSYITDQWPRLQSHSKLVLLAVSGAGFLCSLPFCCGGGIHLFTIWDQRGTVSGVLMAFLQVVLISWFYGMNNFYVDAAIMGMAFPRWVR